MDSADTGQEDDHREGDGRSQAAQCLMHPGDAERTACTLTQQMAGPRQATARRIARRVAAAHPDAGRQPGLIARIVAALIRLAKRFAELVEAGARAIAEKYRNTRE